MRTEENNPQQTQEDHIRLLLGSFLFDQIKKEPVRIEEIRVAFLNYLSEENDKNLIKSYFKQLQNQKLKEEENRFQNEGGGTITD